MRVTHHVTPAALAKQIVEDHLEDYNHHRPRNTSDIEKLVIALDAEMQSYEFTLRLAKHFVQSLRIACAKTGEEFNIQDLAPKPKPAGKA